MPPEPDRPAAAPADAPEASAGPAGDAPAAPDLVALVGSRLCHDLISPIGAIGNGVELLALDAGARSPEVALIGESVAQASARLRFFRIAFGPAATDQRLGRPEVQGVLTDLTRGSRLTFDWMASGDLSRAEARLVFLALMAFETAMPWGGRVAVTRGEEGTGWRLSGDARRLRIDPDLWARLSAARGAAAFAADLPASLVHFALLAETLAATGRRIAVKPAETTLDLWF